MRSLKLAAGVMAAGLAVTLATMTMGACSGERSEFDTRNESFLNDASPDAPAPGPGCGHQCSLDGRSVINTCTGETVQTCAADLACGAGVCQPPCAAAAADKSSNGCDFYFQEPRFEYTTISQSCYAAYVVNTSMQPVEVSMELEGKPLDLSRALYRAEPGSAEMTPLVGPIPPGESAILFISDKSPDTPLTPLESAYLGCPEGVVPASYVGGTPWGTGYGVAFHLTTNAPVSLAAVFPFGGASSAYSSATLLLPVPTWAKQHMIVNAWEMFRDGFGPGAQIFAAEDDTEVTIVPSRPIQSGKGVTGAPARVPVTYHLDKGQLLQIAQNEELTGSLVSSTKPTAIVGGHACANVPTHVTTCDVLAQQIPALEQWGHEYVGVGYAPRMGGEDELMMYRIIAARDGTRLDYDPALPAGAPVTMSAGEHVSFPAGVGEAFVVRTQDADHPIYLAAYMPGHGAAGGIWTGSDGRGDPDFVNVVPAGQYMSSYSFYADPTFADTSLVLVRAKTNGEFKDVSLECAGTLTDWKPVGTRGDYEFTRVILSRNYRPGDSFDGGGTCQYGLQRTKSDGPFTATIWGTAYCVSYGYTGGMALRKLVEIPLDVPH